VLEKQCIGERIGAEATLRERVSNWNADRNTGAKRSTGSLKTADARIKPPPALSANSDGMNH